MIVYVRELPEHVKLSDQQKSQADGYIRVLSNGKGYYVPLTKEMKKLFGISRKKDTIEFKDFNLQYKLDEMARVIIDAVYLQTRDTVGVEVREEMVRMVEDKLHNVLIPQIDDEIEKKFEAKEPKLLDAELPDDAELTCNHCAEKDCPFRGDPYNTNGDCLADK